jgi:hypothetical protein
MRYNGNRLIRRLEASLDRLSVDDARTRRLAESDAQQDSTASPHSSEGNLRQQNQVSQS